MPIPGLTRTQKRKWRDKLTVYRAVKNADNNIVGIAVVPVSATDSTPQKNVPGSWHGTPNFDTAQGGVVTFKENNIFTANKWNTVLGLDIQPDDYVKVTLRNGATDWQMVAGAPKIRVLIPHMQVYLVPANTIPTILTGIWTPTRTS